MKVAICLPSHGDPKMMFACSLAHLTYNTAQARPDIELGIFSVSSSRLPAARNRLVAEGEKWGADWLLMLDVDHSFPGDALLRLLAHGKDAIGISQPTRSDSPEPTARYQDGSFAYTTADKKAAPEQVWWNGLAMLLVSAEALKKLERPLFAFDTDELGEDHFFCRRLIAAAVPLFVDHALSDECRHMHTIGLGHEHVRRSE
jgi:hypothetical protein